MEDERRETVPPAPSGREMLYWIGPGIIWMISAIATGELIFTPRIASLFGYTVLWMLLIAIFLKALIAREIGRYAVITGSSLLYGIKQFPGPRNWGVWLIILPQYVVAVATVTGMAGATGSAIILAIPGDFRFWGFIAIIASGLLVLLGKYRGVEYASIAFSIAITIALVITAALEFPGVGVVATGLVPAMPPDPDLAELLPWLGFMMSGAAGLIWYSYWLAARGYGAAFHIRSEEAEPIDYEALTGEERARLKQWIKAMTGATATSASIVLILLIALLILGTELLRPEGLLPEGPEVTAVLSMLLGETWGIAGAALMIIASFFAFWSTIIANMDGWGRMQGQGSIFIARQFKLGGRATSLRFYRYLYIIGLMGVLPAILFFIIPEPVQFLIVGGIVEAIHIPVVAFSVLYLNWRTLPQELKPSKTVILLMLAAALFFVYFAGFYLYTVFLD